MYKNEFIFYYANFLLLMGIGIHTCNVSMYDLNARLWLVISQLSGRVLDCHQEMHVPNTERSAHCYNRLGTLKELSHFQPDISVSVN